MRFYGAVGYTNSTEQAPGVWKDVITEVFYIGDVVRNSRRLEPSTEQVNDNIRVDNSFSVVADAYAMENYSKIRYVMWNGKPWMVTNVEVRQPRLVLEVGGLWNGITA